MNTHTDVETLLRRCYAAFNDRDLEGALSMMRPDVTWPNGWEGGCVKGRDGVREYWQRQWTAIDPRVEPARIVCGEALEMLMVMNMRPNMRPTIGT
jgi:ketosteroid isomerase-like protein